MAGSHVQTPLKSWLFAGFCIRNCINCFHNCEDHTFIHFTSAVQYLKYFTYSFTFMPHGLLGTNTWQAPNVSVFLAQLVSKSHRCRGVTGSNPVKVLTLSGFYILNWRNGIHNCEDDSLLDFTSTVQYLEYFTSYIKFIPHGLHRTHKWPAPTVSGSIAQLVRASHLYRKVMGSNPDEVLTFLGFYIRNCISCFYTCEAHSLLDFTSAVQHMKYSIL